MRRYLFFLLIGIAFGLSGCTLAPKYTRPAAPVPADWPKGTVYQETRTATGNRSGSEVKWQEFFTDEKLQKIITMALKNNRDLRLAVLNVERARALYGIQRAELLPVVNAAGVMSRQRVPADLSTSGKATTVQQYGVNLGISSWEIDFFGRVRSLKDRALEEYLATEQAGRSAQILLVSAVANAYLALAADRENLKLAESTLETQQTTYKLIQKRYDVGLASELDLHRVQSQVDIARGDAARYTQLAAQDENALNLLVGSPAPGEYLPAELGSGAPLREISPGTPSEVLLHRPDILAAEHRLKAANANIGAARAAFFPRITLTTAFGTASVELSGLFKSGSDTWSFAPQIVLPIFDARTWSAYDATKIDREIAVAQYEKAIQAAFREVADALAVQGAVKQQITAQQSLVDAFTQTYRLSDARYTKGIDSYLGVLDAQRSLNAARQGLIVLRLVRLTNLVAIYKAVGQ
ncbi:MAG: multidrug transporter [Syntrophus sp. (in: bacteria)]|nr:multidrug transporter [Syntrophus sp. (in: bacteria)]